MVLFLKFFKRCVALFHLDLFEIVLPDILEVLGSSLVLVLHLGEFEVDAGLHGTGLLGDEELFLGEASTLLIHNEVPMRVSQVCHQELIGRCLLRHLLRRLRIS